MFHFIHVLLLFLLHVLFFLFFLRSSFSRTIVVGGVSEQNHRPTLLVGDSLVFKHKSSRSLYIFHTRRAFENCNYAEATLLHSHSSITHVTWRPLSPGHYYFSFGSSSQQQQGSCGKTFEMRVVAEYDSAPPPVSGRDDDLYPLMPHPHELSTLPSTPTQSPEPSLPLLPGSFIGSNPALPLPPGEADPTTIHPLPAAGDENQAVGREGIQRTRSLLFMVVAFAAAVAFD